jgi:hypothetical protein
LSEAGAVTNQKRKSNGDETAESLHRANQKANTSRILWMAFCATLRRKETGLGGSALAETGERPSAGFVPGHAPAGMALSRGSAPAAGFPDPIRFRLGRARRTRRAGLRHAVLQRREGLLPPKVRQERAPGRPGLDGLVEVPGRLRATSRVVRHAFGGSGGIPGRGSSSRPGGASANFGRLTAWIFRGWFRSFRTAASLRLAPSPLKT